jgi:hypothetical protein
MLDPKDQIRDQLDRIRDPAGAISGAARREYYGAAANGR